MSLCYRSTEHRNPAGARFCVECGSPLRQPCPNNPAHELDVLRADGSSPRSCPECGGLLRPCARCRRLHRLTEAVCRTRGCRGDALPPLRSDWPGWGGGPACRGLALRRELSVNPQVEWSVHYRAPYAAAVSAYGNLYVAFADTLVRLDDPHQEQACPREMLRGRVVRHPGALLAGGGRLMVLTEEGAGVHTPDRLTPVGEELRGDFRYQTLWEDRWLLHGTLAGSSVPGVFELPIDNPHQQPYPVAGSEGLSLRMPVVRGTTPFWPGEGARLYRQDDQGLHLEYRAEGEWVAAVATEDEGPLVLLAREGNAVHRLHFWSPQGVVQAPVPGTMVQRRLWSAGPHVFVARRASTTGEREEAAMIRFDVHAPSAQPVAQNWPAGLRFEDAMLVRGGATLAVELALVETSTETGRFVRLLWDEHRIGPVGEPEPGMEGADWLAHEACSIAVIRYRNQDGVTIRGQS